jgi:hypothetical protein
VAATKRELAAAPPAAWLTGLDATDYYAQLPESLRELAERWRRERLDRPGMVPDHL